MGESLINKLKKIKENLDIPPSLSSVEVEKITETFDAMKAILDDTLIEVLDKDRAEAFRYTNLLVQALQQADINFKAGIPPTEVDARTFREKKDGATEKPDFLAFKNNLTPKQLSIAEKLDCFKQFEEVGDAIVCNDCSMEKMLACIRLEDPSIDPNKDYELDIKMIRGELDKP